jgi:hypothetical protein
MLAYCVSAGMDSNILFVPRVNQLISHTLPETQKNYHLALSTLAKTLPQTTDPAHGLTRELLRTHQSLKSWIPSVSRLYLELNAEFLKFNQDIQITLASEMNIDKEKFSGGIPKPSKEHTSEKPHEINFTLSHLSSSLDRITPPRIVKTVPSFGIQNFVSYLTEVFSNLSKNHELENTFSSQCYINLSLNPDGTATWLMSAHNSQLSSQTYGFDIGFVERNGAIIPPWLVYSMLSSG